MTTLYLYEPSKAQLVITCITLITSYKLTYPSFLFLIATAQHMVSAFTNGSPEPDTFPKFFECWLDEQNQNLQQLISASKNIEPGQGGDETELCPLVDRVVKHYEQYYEAKSRWAKEDPLVMLSPSWTSSLEEAFLWMGGWRPSMAFHLLYSKSGLQLEARLQDLIRGLSTGDLGDLSPSQLNRVDELQMRTIKEEKEVTEKMEKQQETVADTSMVELSHVVSEMIREERSVGAGVGGMEERVESALAPKEEGMENIVHRADDLRLRTLKAIIEILTPLQGVHFLIAAAELHLRLHEWGKKRDAKKQQASDETVHPN